MASYGFESLLQYFDDTLIDLHSPTPNMYVYLHRYACYWSNSYFQIIFFHKNENKKTKPKPGFGHAEILASTCLEKKDVWSP